MNQPILRGAPVLQTIILANVERWRREHGMLPKRPTFKNEPRLLKLSKKTVTIDVEAKVEVQS